MNKIKNYVLFFILIYRFSLEGLVDLESMQQDFVLKTKKINLLQYPDAFNPSIVRWKGSFLLSFRARDPITGYADLVGLTWLDKEFNPIGEPKIITFQHIYPAGSYVQDPRLILINDKLFLVYSNLWKLGHEEIRRMFIAEIEYDGEHFISKKPTPLLDFEGDHQPRKFEKNWVPFIYGNKLLLSYSINPHKVFYPLFEEKRCETIALTQMETDWEEKWGELRGGTQALLVNGQYLSFFHSSKQMRTKHSDNHLMPHYFMGAYTFEAHPPFTVTKISPEIIVGKNFYEGPSHKTWKPLRVVFPCGFIFNKHAIWISYGRQDFEIWMVKLDKKKLFKSLIPVKML